MTSPRRPGGKLPPSVELFLPDARLRTTGQGRLRVKLPALDQIGIVVKDVDKAIEYYSSVFGLGPFYVREVEPDNMVYRGQVSGCRMKLAFTVSGPVEIELIQILEGETIHSDFLREKGEGLHHLRFRVDNVNDMLGELAEDGIEPVWQNADHSMACLNSDKVGGVVFEIIEGRRNGQERS
ncbi:VOC family protein [Chloroflexota bacterium]